MSESTESGSSSNPLDPNNVLGAGPDSGQQRGHVEDSGQGSEGAGQSYVDGDYGDAGVVDDVVTTPNKQGEYTSGNFGRAGSSAASEDGDPDSEGQYPEGDYGQGGRSGPVSSAEPGGEKDAEYPEGDYGAAGEVGQDKYPKGERPWEGS